MSRTPGSSVAALATLLLSVACSSDVASPARPTLSAAKGDQQSALAGTALPAPVAVMLHDGKDRPMAGIHIVWTAQASGHDVVLPEKWATDPLGYASARWLLDSTVGIHTLDAAGPGGALVHLRAFANPRPYSNVSPLPLTTYDGSGEAVHPDFVRVPQAWGGDPFRLVATPYPGGNQTFENPSLFTGSDESVWSVPAGMQNPLVAPLSGYLSDPDMLYDPVANELRIYYRREKEQNEIWLLRSLNSVIWSAPVLVVNAPNHMVVSPSVVRRAAGEWLMWSVNGGTRGCAGPSTTVELRRSSDGVSWSAPEPVMLSDRDGFAWHIDVEWVPSRGEFWAVYPIKQPGSCVTDELRFATSADGVHGRSYPSPLLLKGANDDLRDIVYRSTIDYDATTELVSVWYSGATYVGGEKNYSWHLAFERMTMSALFARVNVPLWEAARVDAAVSLPQLTNETAP